MAQITKDNGILRTIRDMDTAFLFSKMDLFIMEGGSTIRGMVKVEKHFKTDLFMKVISNLIRDMALEF